MTKRANSIHSIWSALLRTGNPKDFVLILLTSAAVTLLMLTGPIFMLQVYDRVLTSGSVETLLTIFLIVAVLYGLQAVLDYSRTALLSRAGLQFVESHSREIFCASLQPEPTENKRTASRGPMADLEAVKGFFQSGACKAVIDVPWCPIFVVVLFGFHPILGWFGVVAIVFLISLTFLSQSLSNRRFSERAAEFNRAQRIMASATEGAEYIFANGSENDFFRRWGSVKSREYSALLGYGDVTGAVAAAGKSLRLFFQSGMLALGAYLSLQGEITAGAIIAGTIILGRATQPIDQLLGSLKVIQSGIKGYKVVLDTCVSARDVEKKLDLPSPDPRMTLCKVACGPRNSEKPSLINVNLNVEPGEALAVVGLSGVGKSTLLKTMAGVWPPLDGEIKLGDAFLDNYSKEAIGRHVGYLPQDIRLFPATIAENIAQMEISTDADLVISAAKFAGVHEMILSLPDGYNTFCGGSTSGISAGQRQLIGLARAIYRRPKVLLLDEPTSFLDLQSSERFKHFVRWWCAEGRAVVFTSHQDAIIKIASRVVYVRGGTVEKTSDEPVQRFLG